MHLLIVEDEEVVAKNLKKLLELKGFAVDWIDNGERARSRLLLYRKEYDIVILDLTLPGMDGMALTKSLRAEGVTTPIIIVTGKSETENKVALLNSGADDYPLTPRHAACAPKTTPRYRSPSKSTHCSNVFCAAPTRY